MLATGNVPAGTEYKTALTDILQTFPYFQLAQVLLAKQMYDSHEPEASMRIKLASVYAPDRKAMYQLFKSTSTLPEIQQEPVAATETKPLVNVTGKEGVKYNFVYSSTTIKKPEETQTPSVAETSGNSTQTESFIRKESETKLPTVAVSEKPAPAVEQKPIAKKIEPITPLPVKKVTPLPSIEKKEDKPVSKPITRVETTSIDKKAEEKNTAPLRPSIIERPFVPIKKEPVPVETKKTETPEDVTQGEPISENRLKYSFSSWLKVLPEINVNKKKAENPVNQKEKADIISNFLENLPSISRPKAEFFSPVKAAKLSITENDEIVSETLAAIYLKQGNLQKAVKAYETLLSQFPEKKNIFAPRIEEIRALIRENTKK